VADKEVELSFISNSSEAKWCDVVIIPGSKRVVDDLLWLRERGFEEILTSKKQKIVAICGGYEMMFERILDPDAVESELKEIHGFGRIKGEVVFAKEKIVKKGCYYLFGSMIEGYEIHNAIAKKRVVKKKNLYATFVHGIFESDEFRYRLFYKIDETYEGYNFKEYKAEAIKEFAEHINAHVDIDFIQKALYE
jgi:adenosylcobyric acid synthase